MLQTIQERLTAAGLVIFGGYVLRYVFVFAGQASGFK